MVLFLTAVAYVFSPFVADLHARGERERLDRLYKAITRWTVAGTIPVLLLMLLAPAAILRLFGGEEFTTRDRCAADPGDRPGDQRERGRGRVRADHGGANRLGPDASTCCPPRWTSRCRSCWCRSSGSRARRPRRRSRSRARTGCGWCSCSGSSGSSRGMRRTCGSWCRRRRVRLAMLAAQAVIGDTKWLLQLLVMGVVRAGRVRAGAAGPRAGPVGARRVDQRLGEDPWTFGRWLRRTARARASGSASVGAPT